MPLSIWSKITCYHVHILRNRIEGGTINNRFFPFISTIYKYSTLLLTALHGPELSIMATQGCKKGYRIWSTLIHVELLNNYLVTLLHPGYSFFFPFNLHFRLILNLICTKSQSWKTKTVTWMSQFLIFFSFDSIMH